VNSTLALGEMGKEVSATAVSPIGSNTLCTMNIQLYPTVGHSDIQNNFASAGDVTPATSPCSTKNIPYL